MSCLGSYLNIAAALGAGQLEAEAVRPSASDVETPRVSWHRKLRRVHSANGGSYSGCAVRTAARLAAVGRGVWRRLKRTPLYGGRRDGRVARLLWLWFRRERLAGVNSRKRDRWGGDIDTRAADLWFRLQLDHVPRER